MKIEFELDDVLWERVKKTVLESGQKTEEILNMAIDLGLRNAKGIVEVLEKMRDKQKEEHNVQ